VSISETRKSNEKLLNDDLMDIHDCYSFPTYLRRDDFSFTEEKRWAVSLSQLLGDDDDAITMISSSCGIELKCRENEVEKKISPFSNRVRILTVGSRFDLVKVFIF